MLHLQRTAAIFLWFYVLFCITFSSLAALLREIFFQRSSDRSLTCNFFPQHLRNRFTDPSFIQIDTKNIAITENRPQLIL